MRIAPEEIARECERLFQNGGPRVYSAEGEHLMPSSMSGAAAARCALPGQTIYARRKVGARYAWVQLPSTTN